MDLIAFGVGVAGFGLLIGGVAMLNVPAALICAGIGLLGWSYAAARGAAASSQGD
ncbi:hypothetical protein [Chitinimonas koreensis]|uniref:hypothetical protein n=1 Tax=Chitinimonas koreensis TaxID=356302 RepID=UPI0003FA3600|nr:hypothetical protein [Chitinimonas koreensis]QNM99066.1 hypothetical protein H9L41_13360 [Chitinimonas koreensis]